MPSGLVELVDAFVVKRYGLLWHSQWKGQMAVLQAQSHWVQNLEYKLQFYLIQAWMQVSQSIDEERQYVIWLFAAFISDVQKVIAYLLTRAYLYHKSIRKGKAPTPLFVFTTNSSAQVNKTVSWIYSFNFSTISIHKY